jgi:hypothetical protein
MGGNNTTACFKALNIIRLDQKTYTFIEIVLTGNRALYHTVARPKVTEQSKVWSAELGLQKSSKIN